MTRHASNSIQIAFPRHDTATRSRIGAALGSLATPSVVEWNVTPGPSNSSGNRFASCARSYAPRAARPGIQTDALSARRSGYSIATH